MKSKFDFLGYRSKFFTSRHYMKQKTISLMSGKHNFTSAKSTFKVIRLQFISNLLFLLLNHFQQFFKWDEIASWIIPNLRANILVPGSNFPPTILLIYPIQSSLAFFVFGVKFTGLKFTKRFMTPFLT